MDIVFHCPECESKIRAERALMGEFFACPTCKARVMVPCSSIGPGVVVGGFKILKKVGTGGMGDVYLAQQQSMGRQVALKVLAADVVDNPTLLRQFVKEIVNQGALIHPHIATAFDSGRDGDIYYLAMEYVDGETLYTILKREAPLPESQAVDIARQVAAGLAYAWKRRQMIHRDIKPANIMINSEGEAKILDMGVSKSKAEMRAAESTTQYMVGTPQYMAPEQFEGEENVDFRADQYALGATLYQMVTGRTPYSGKTFNDVLIQQSKGLAVSPRSLNPSLSKSVVRLIERMMAEKPEDRYESWEQLIADFDRVSAGGRSLLSPLEPSLSMVESAGRKSLLESATEPTLGAGVQGDNPRLWIAAVGVSLLLALLAGAMLLLSNSSVDDAVETPAPVSGSDPVSVAPVSVVPESQDESEQDVKDDAEYQRQLRDIENLYVFVEKQLKEHPNDYVENRKLLKQLYDDAFMAGYSKYKILAEQASQKLEVSYRHRVQEARTNLRNSYIKYHSAGEFEKALQLLSSYKGPFLPELSSRIAKWSQEASEDLQRSKEEAHAREQQASEGYEQLLEEVAQLLVNERDLRTAQDQVATALNLYADTGVAENLRALSALLQAGRMRESYVLNTFNADVGLQTNVELRSGTFDVMIMNVTNSMVSAQRQLAVGSVGFDFTMQDLTLQEVFKRLSRVEGDEGAFICGMFALSQKNLAVAREKFLAIQHELGSHLLSNMPDIEPKSSKRAKYASGDQTLSWQAFESLLETAGLPRADRDENAILDLYGDLSFTQEKRDLIRKLTVYFLSQHGDSPPARNYPNLLNLLVTEGLYASKTPEEVQQDLMDANPGYKGKGRIQYKYGRVTKLNLYQAGPVSDISSLKDLPLEYLKLAGSGIQDLSALANMPLTVLYLVDTRVRDLSVLAHLPLRSLFITGCNYVHDVEALSGLSLQTLDLTGTPVKDLSPLSSMPLENLKVGSEVSSLKPVLSCPIHNLVLDGSKVSRLDSLSRMPVRSLSILDCPVLDVSPLKDVSLQMLTFEPWKVKKGLDILRKHSTLNRLRTDRFQPYMTPLEFWLNYDSGDLKEAPSTAPSTYSPE